MGRFFKSKSKPSLSSYTETPVGCGDMQYVVWNSASIRGTRPHIAGSQWAICGYVAGSGVWQLAPGAAAGGSEPGAPPLPLLPRSHHHHQESAHAGVFHALTPFSCININHTSSTTIFEVIITFKTWEWKNTHVCIATLEE